MINTDPIQQAEEAIKSAHNSTERYVKPVLSRYPLLFAFTIAFSIAAISHGFELWADQYEVFHKYPSLLISIGIVALFLTGTLYKKLNKDL